jgi:MHS family citrate/tricarballylate:H+ symporter-like MFS transporter
VRRWRHERHDDPAHLVEGRHRAPRDEPFTALTILSSYASMAWLVAAPSLGHMLLVELWLSLLYGSYNGAMVVTLTEVMPVEVRTVGFSLAYSLATALFGGFTPAVSTWLIEVTGDRAAPGLWMSFSAVCGLTGTWIVYSRRSRRSRRRRDRGVAPTPQ